MSRTQKTPRILIIDPTDDVSAWQTGLETQAELEVKHLPGADANPETVLSFGPDLIILHAALAQPPAHVFLADLQAHKVDTPVVLVGTNGQMASIDFNYPHIIGWISYPINLADLDVLIEAALKRSLPATELILAKRAELVETNRKLTNRVQELQALSEIGKSVTSHLDLEKVLSLVVEAAVNLTGADESYLLLVDEASSQLYLRAKARPEGNGSQDFWEASQDETARQVVQSGEPVILSRNGKDYPLKNEYSIVNVPVVAGGQVIGVLGARNYEQQRAFAEDDGTLLAALGDWAAIAIQNAKHYQETQRFSRNLQLVNEVSQLVSSSLDVEQIPYLLLERTARLVGAECGSLALLSRDRNGVIFQVAYDGQGQELKGLKDFLMPLGQGIIGVVAQTGQPIVANDVQNHPAWSPLPDQLTGFTTKKLVAVPLIIEGEILGVMELLNKKEGEFNLEDVQLLSLVASAAAGAIQNGRQYEALKQANQALREAQEQQIAAERWTVLGKAAANLAHRINNSTALVPIAAQHTRELLQQVKMPPDLRQDIEGNLDRIARNSLYTVELARVLLRRFRRNPSEARDINTLIERALALVNMPPNIRVVRHLDPGLAPVETSDLLVDVFVELITNAVQAIGQKEGLLRIATFKAGKQKVSIQITDSGPGISPENVEHIFDMFYTTNPTGLGFGLWWVKTFLEQQQGEIVVESQPDEQTTFTVTLLCKPSPLHSQPK
jgi:two-component system NtrC family sensor kinase